MQLNCVRAEHHRVPHAVDNFVMILPFVRCVCAVRRNTHAAATIACDSHRNPILQFHRRHSAIDRTFRLRIESNMAFAQRCCRCLGYANITISSRQRPARSLCNTFKKAPMSCCTPWGSLGLLFHLLLPSRTPNRNCPVFGESIILVLLVGISFVSTLHWVQLMRISHHQSVKSFYYVFRWTTYHFFLSLPSSFIFFSLFSFVEEQTRTNWTTNSSAPKFYKFFVDFCWFCNNSIVFGERQPSKSSDTVFRRFISANFQFRSLIFVHH